MALDLSVVIPTYNEAENVEALYQRLTAELGKLGLSYEVILVDDGSVDDTFARLRRLHLADPRLRVVRLRRNFGQTAALCAGFDHARGEVVVTMDADLQNDPADVGVLLEHISRGYDIASGWRVRRRDPFLTRRLPSMVANTLISWATGVKLHDYGCSLKAYRQEVVKGIRLYGEMHRFIPAIAAGMGVSVAEVPVRHSPRRFGRSKYGLSRTLKVLLDLLVVRFLVGYSTRPIHLFGILGLGSFSLGVIFGLRLVYEKLVEGHSIGERPLLLLSVLLVLVGVQLLTMGLIAELLTRTYHESQDKPIYSVRQVLDASYEEVEAAEPALTPSGSR